MNYHLWWVHAHYSPRLVELWSFVSSHLRCINPTHRRRTGGPGGAAQRGVRLDLGGVSQSTLWRQGCTLVRFIFIFYFVRLSLCNNYFYDIVRFISIHSIIICVVFFGAYMRCTKLYPLNLGVTDGVKEIILVRFIYYQLFCKIFSLCNKFYDIYVYTLNHCICWSSLAHIWYTPRVAP
jgi:hypothetical protein